MSITWSKEEEDLLEKYWPSSSKEFIEKALPEKSWNAICHKASRLNLDRKSLESWSEQELTVLIREWPNSTKEKIQSFLPNRSWPGIKNKASILNLKKVEPVDRPISYGRIYKERSDLLSEGDTFRFGIVADTHFASKYAQLTYLHDFYGILNKRRIKICFHAGDLTEGNGTHYHGQMHEMHITGADNLKEFTVKNYPKLNNGKTYIIAGWHDLDLWTKEGYDLLDNVTRARPDMVYLGQNDAYYILGNRKVYLLHPGGGTAYAISYKSQKLIESFSSENKPHIAIIGHYHKAEFISLRNVYCFQAGCFQAQTPFATRKSLQFHYGGWIVEMTVTKAGISSIKPEFIPFYDPIPEDYRSYD